MGQSQSSPPAQSNPLTKTQHLFLSLSKTLPPLTLQDYNTIFSSLAESTNDNVTYWKEDTLARFLEVPAKIGSLLFKSCSYLAALPTLEGVPVPLDRDGLGIAVLVLTQRVPRQVLTEREAQRLLFNSFAEVTANELHKKEKEGEGGKEEERLSSGTYGPRIPVQTMTELILFLLSITTSSTMTSSEATLLKTTSPESRRAAVECATSLLSSLQRYAKDPSESISYDAFRAFLEHDAPYFFDPLVPLFEKLLYDKHKWGTNPTPREDWRGALECEDVEGSVLSGYLPQMSMFFPKERRVGKLVPLYMGSKDGFSMGMFESKVLKYPGTQNHSQESVLTVGPTIMLVKGTIDESSDTKSQPVLFGVYISTPWKSSTKGTPPQSQR